MVAGAVGAEICQDGGQRGGWHGDLEEVVYEGDLRSKGSVCWNFEGEKLAERDVLGVTAHHAVVGTAFASKGHGLCAYTLVDDAVRKHGLRCDAKDEGSETVVVARVGFLPHPLIRYITFLVSTHTISKQRSTYHP